MSTRSSGPILAAAALAALLGIASAGSASADTSSVPAYAQPVQPGSETIGGIILAYDGHFAVTLQDDRGFNDTVRLRNGTEIDPEGVRLHRGERVIMHGHADGDVFAADTVALDDSAGAPGGDQLYTDDGSYQYSAGYDDGDGYGYGGAYYGGGGYYGGGYGHGSGYNGNGNGGQTGNGAGQLGRRPVRQYPGGGGGAGTRRTLGGGGSGGGGGRSAPVSHSSGSSHH